MPRKVLWEKPRSVMPIIPAAIIAPVFGFLDGFDKEDEELDGDDEQDGVVFDSADYETVGSGPDGEWTDADEAGLEEHEISKRERIALENEY